MDYFHSSLPVCHSVDDFYAFVRWIPARCCLTRECSGSLHLTSGSSLSGAPPARESKPGLRAPTAQAAPCPFRQAALVRAGEVTGRDHRQSQRRQGNKSAPESSWQQQRQRCSVGVRSPREMGPSGTGDVTATGMPRSPCPVREAARDRAGHSQPVP